MEEGDDDDLPATVVFGLVGDAKLVSESLAQLRPLNSLAEAFGKTIIVLQGGGGAGCDVGISVDVSLRFVTEFTSCL